MIGIERVVYRDIAFTALEDVQALVDADGASVVGRQLLTTDLVGSVSYPRDARTTTQLVRPYVYFRGPGVEFLATHDFRSQFVREVVGAAGGLPHKQWNRWTNVSRDNMFNTFTRLASAFRESTDTRFGFTPRAGM
jgi:hypothetical protein